MPLSTPRHLLISCVNGTTINCSALTQLAGYTSVADHSTSSGHGTMVDFTVFIAIASATACPMPCSVNG